MAASLLGLGTATPSHLIVQSDAAEHVVALSGAEGTRAAVIRRTFKRAGVERRYSVLPSVAPGEGPFGGERAPGTAARMRIFREHAGPLAAEACARALRSARVEAPAITHLVVVTCTGFHAPGIDVELVTRLGLSQDVDRTLVGFMGCYGAFAGLRVARRAVEADPAAVALVVCVELCTLHLRADSESAVVAHALFGDAASACVVAAAEESDALLVLGPAATRVVPDTDELMGWTIGDDGFEMTLSARCPSAIAGALADFVRPLARGEEVAAWCVHPGGPSILAAAEESLGLPEDALAVSRGVLRDPGNVSSATILFVLERMLPRMRAGERGMALGFGPGLTFEGFAFTRGARALLDETPPAAVPAAAPVAPALP
jgi:predicted naringenin-chalcone synthase